MKLKIKILCFLLAITILFTSGCSSNKKSKADKIAESVKLVYYTIGTPDEDLEKVNKKLNELLYDKNAGFSVSYRKIDWADYGDKINAVFGSGDFDIAFATGPTQGNFLSNARRGVWLELSDYLFNADEGKQLYNTIDKKFWEGSMVENKIYGVPTNKELSSPEWFLYSKKLVEKYNIDITSIKSLSDLEPYLKIIKEQENSNVAFRLDIEQHNFFAINGYEYAVNTQIPLMIKSTDEKAHVVNIFDTEDGKQVLNILRKYYKEGYINKDATLRDSTDVSDSNKMFVTISSGGPYSDATWSSHFGTDIVSNQVSPSVVTTEYARGGMMAVNATTEHKEECLKFLYLLNTDSEIRNLLNYGIEGEHYNLTYNNQIEKISTKYSGIQYTQGNWFILKTLKGEPLDKWDIYKDFNDTCTSSVLLGFSPQTAEIEPEITAVSNVLKQYYAPLMTGTIDTDKYLPVFINKLNEAGIHKIQEEIQKQIDDFLAQKKQ